MLKALAVQLGDCVVLLLEPFYAVQEWECDLLLGLVVVLWAAVVYGALELADCLDQSLRLLGEVVFLFRDDVELVVECF